MRPRGTPPMPSAASRASEPVGMASTSMLGPSSPNLMMEPLPNFLIISSSVALRTFSRSSPVVAGRISLDVPLVLAMCAPLLSCCLDVRRTPVLSQHPWAHLRLEDLRLADTWHTANFRPAYRTLSATATKQPRRNVKQKRPGLRAIGRSRNFPQGLHREAQGLWPRRRSGPAHGLRQSDEARF